MMKITIFGIVQGVGFRPTVYRVAKRMGLTGYVLNNGSNVEVVVDRDPEKFLKNLRDSLPALARIDLVQVEEAEGEYDDFTIVESKEGRKVSLIPTDTAICENCMSDFEEEGNRRNLFPFTNCTECGARFTIISDLPFDRARTTMTDFPMCPRCEDEYSSSSDRRFHAQTISCPDCGPKYVLYDGAGKELVDEPFTGFASRIDSGEVGIMKGWGGMHVVCTLSSADRLRELYRRGDKPYAIMTRNIQAAEKYAHISDVERGILTSPQRPIVILKKRDEAFDILSLVSPDLANVGIMLPYSAAHLLLFDRLGADAVVMTSANPPGEPMVIENDMAFDLGLDCYLMHNRKIIHRCDDSVVKPISGRPAFIRKSRGFVPVPLKANHRRTVIGVGAQWDVTGSLTRNGEMFLTQYIGESQQHPTLEYLGEAIHHMARLLGTARAEAIAMDRHPRYSTRVMARRLAKEHDCEMIETQHYHAHLASLMIDRGLQDRIVCLTWDGTGYGDDGSSWGGETLLGGYSAYSRLCTLEGIPLLGGDRAVVDPKRVVTAIQLMLGSTPSFADGDAVEVFSKMMKSSVTASSMGRVLDSVSCILGICCKRSYEGEPAIKLERWLETGRAVHEYEVEFGRKDGLDYAKTLPMFEQLLRTKVHSDAQKADAATSFVKALTTALSEKACDFAEDHDVKTVGLSGGVSYSSPISSWVEEVVVRRDLEFVSHERVPNGDGGISVGQNAIAGSLLG